jgi:DhnA family fructose-bisphosphate aldolase class Ia
MVAIVSFMRAKSGGADVGAVGSVRKMEILTVPNTSTITAESDEVAIVLNTEAAAILVAFGSTPDAQATTETSATSAGQAIPIGLTTPALLLRQGDKISVKALP